MNTQRYAGPALVAVALVAVLAFSGVNVGAIAPFALILILCPLMMFFMMRGMDHGGSNRAGHDHSTHTGQDRQG